MESKAEFALYTDNPVITGRFNLAFIFQVNCPGCFIYGIPLVNHLWKTYSAKLHIVGVSTAFEDFEYNTCDHTKLLLDTGVLIGETKKYFAALGIFKYPEEILFPVVMDQLTTGSDFNPGDEFIEKLIRTFPGYDRPSPFDIIQFRKNLLLYYRKQPIIPLTFTLNQLNGTPSFILFDEEYMIKASYFGHVELKLIDSLIKEWLEQG